MRNHSVPGRARGFLGSFFGPGLGLGLGLGLGFGLLSVVGCQGSTTGGDPNFHPADSRRSMGNPLVGALCDNVQVCPDDSRGMKVPCLTANLYDTVGLCAPSCTTDSDCDTYLPGLPICTTMGGALECVIFCDQNKVNTSRICPDKWTCQLVSGPQQAYSLCVPPQTRLTPDGGA